MVTQQTSVARLFSGVVKPCWIWHGKVLRYFAFSVSNLEFRSLIGSCMTVVAGWRILFWGTLWRECQRKRRMRKRIPKTPLLTEQKMSMV